MAEVTPSSASTPRRAFRRQAGDGVTAFILAGGLSSRFGTDKALARWNGKPLVAHMADLLKPIFPKRVVLAKSPADYAALTPGVPVRADGAERRHPLVGILSALKASDTDMNFVCACDMPLLRTALVEEMIAFSSGYDAVVPLWRGEIQPLCGLYSKRCVHSITELLQEEHASCADLYGRIQTRFFLEPEVAMTDPDGESFLDVDTPEYLRKALEKLR